MSQFYSASIVGSLLAEPVKFIKTLDDLANSDLDIGIEDLGYNHNLFEVCFHFISFNDSK